MIYYGSPKTPDCQCCGARVSDSTYKCIGEAGVEITYFLEDAAFCLGQGAVRNPFGFPGIPVCQDAAGAQG